MEKLVPAVTSCNYIRCSLCSVSSLIKENKKACSTISDKAIVHDTQELCSRWGVLFSGTSLLFCSALLFQILLEKFAHHVTSFNLHICSAVQTQSWTGENRRWLLWMELLVWFNQEMPYSLIKAKSSFLCMKHSIAIMMNCFPGPVNIVLKGSLTSILTLNRKILLR